MDKIYLPIDNVSDYKCYSVFDKDTIRAYYQTPRVDTEVNYTDFYINSHYLEKEGTQRFYNSSYLPNCIPSNAIVNDNYYRTDLFQSLGIFVLLVSIMFVFPLKFTWLRLFRRFN